MEKYLLHNIYLTDKIISIKKSYYFSLTNVTYISILEWPTNLHLGYARYWTFEITSADLQRRCTETNKVPICTHAACSHSSEVRYFCLMKCSREMFQNLLHIWNPKSCEIKYVASNEIKTPHRFSYSKYMANCEVIS